MKKILFLAFLLSAWIKPVAAQDNRRIDSLKHLLVTAKEDTNKVKLYSDLSWQYVWSYPDSALLYYAPGLKLAQKLDFLKGQLTMMDVAANAYGTKGNHSESLHLAFQMMKLAQNLNDSFQVAVACNVVANCYYTAGDYKNALAYWYRAKSNAAFFKAKHLLILGFIGETYVHLNNLDSAYKYLEQCRQEDLKQTDHWSVPYLYLGQVYEKKGDPGRAIKYYKMGAGYSGQKLDTAQGYNYLASAFKMKGETDSAVFYASKAIAISLKSSLSETLIEASRMLTELYRAKHLPDSALKYQDIMLAAKDSAFSKEKIKQMENFAFDEQMRQQAILEKQDQYRNSVKMYSLVAVVGVFLVLAIILWRNNQHKQQANEQIQKTLAELKATQTQLILSEKMASLGELTAGIAHEIQNPLNFVNNFSEVNAELIGEMKDEIAKGDLEEIKAIAIDIEENSKKIGMHGKRADAIVKGMLQHSQSGSGAKEPTNINELADNYMRLAYQGLLSKDKNFKADMVTHFDPVLPKVNVIPQDIGRVLLNLFNNAFYAVNQKQKTAGADYKPEVSVSTSTANGQVVITVKDNGTGIPDAVKEKIMQPFFTTKPTGEGTGLGLSLTYDMVVKGHGGSIEVDTKEGEFTQFMVRLP